MEGRPGRVFDAYDREGRFLGRHTLSGAKAGFKDCKMDGEIIEVTLLDNAESHISGHQEEAELWAPISRYEGRYEASNLGRIRSIPPLNGSSFPRVLEPGTNEHGLNDAGMSSTSVYLRDEEGRGKKGQSTGLWQAPFFRTQDLAYLLTTGTTTFGTAESAIFHGPTSRMPTNS